MTNDPSYSCRSVGKRLLRKRDFYAGLLMVLVGLVAIYKAPSYRIGTLMHMGPGFMPMALGVLMVLLGAALAVSTLTLADGEGEGVLPEQAQWRGWSCVLAGPLLFLFLGQIGGMAPATFFCVFVSALGDRAATLKSSLVLATFVTIFGVVVFSYLLQSPMPVLTWKGL